MEYDINTREGLLKWLSPNGGETPLFIWWFHCFKRDCNERAGRKLSPQELKAEFDRLYPESNPVCTNVEFIQKLKEKESQENIQSSKEENKPFNYNYKIWKKE